MTMMTEIMKEPMWLQLWVFWMMILNTLSIVFVKHMGGRVTLACWIGNVILMSVLFDTFGYTRLLGISHVVFWTPLVIYLVRSWPSIKDQGIYTRWVLMLLVTNCASLVIDYIDVIRWAIGDGALD